jgi:hypothetical protein
MLAAAAARVDGFGAINKNQNGDHRASSPLTTVTIGALGQLGSAAK